MISVVENQFYGTDGKLIFPGMIRIRETKWEPNTAGIPTRYHHMDATACVGSESLKWSFRMTEAEADDFKEHIAKYLPAGIEFDNERLQKAIEEYSSDPLSYRSIPEVHQDSSGTYHFGKRLTDMQVEICEETPTPNGPSVFKIRRRSPEGKYFYGSGSFSDLVSGELARRAGVTKRFDPIALHIALYKQWRGRSDVQKKQFRADELLQRRRGLDDDLRSLGHKF